MTEWYYADGGRQAGPVSREELDRRVKAGELPENTLVWCDGMANWQSYSQAPAGDAPVIREDELPAADRVFCSQCGRPVASGETVSFGGQSVCATCKPVFVQKLREGVLSKHATFGRKVYAGFGRRLAAYLLDYVILLVVNQVLSTVVKFSIRAVCNDPSLAATLEMLFALFLWLVNFSYEVFFLVKFGATPGKLALKIRVVTATGEPLTVGRAIGRTAAKILSGCLLLIGFIIAAFDDQRRALHDYICNTRVVLTE